MMNFLLCTCALLWLSITVCGVVYLAQYNFIPAREVVAYPADFPPESRINRDGQTPTLIFFAHPKCPCTRASLRELSRLMTDVDGRLQAYIVFSKPENQSEQWTATDLRNSAEAIPNVSVVIDEGERETRIFNARTSGLTLLYDQGGNLRFNGGITASRGHEGDNAGKSAIFEIIMRDNRKTAETAVYGCPLHRKSCSGELMQNAR